ncbi:MAG: GntR family transcriptional regulator [Chloroflexi bacterium]|nr:GntR family transcriptional regulator [Chloroflexota bacterium]
MQDSVPVIKRIRLVDQIADILRQMILGGRLQPGERLVQEKLAEKLNVSRTPLREAYRKLEEEGLLCVTPSGMIEVMKLDLHDALDIYDVREVLDGLAARLAAQRITPDELETLEASLNKMKAMVDNPDIPLWTRANLDFHLTITKASHNQRFVQFIPSIRMSAQMLFPVLLCRAERITAALREHTSIFDAIKDGDPDVAERCAKTHILSTKVMIQRELRQMEQREITEASVS